jgi:hypothetical protein
MSSSVLVRSAALAVVLSIAIAPAAPADHPQPAGDIS